MSKKEVVVTRSGHPLRPPGPRPAPAAIAGRVPHGEERLWRTVRGGAALYRRYIFPNPAVAASFSQLAVGLAAHTKLPLFVRLLDSQVTLVLRGEGSRQISALAGELFDRVASLS
jgi:hypothetical protein